MISIFIKNTLLNLKTLFSQINQKLEEDYLRWILWSPIALGSGILLYIQLQSHGLWVLSICAMGWIIGWKNWNHHNLSIRFLLRGFFCVSSGCFLAHFSAPPPLPSLKETPIWVKGKICQVQHLATKDRLIQKITLNHLQFGKKKYLNPSLKIILKIQTENEGLYEGDEVSLLAGFYPDNRKGLPQDSFLKRHQWLEQVMAYGYTLNQPIIESRDNNLLDIWRHSLTRFFHEKLKPPLGAMACALFTGDKAALPPFVKEAFSFSGLSHLLAISGLHLSAVTAGCFFILIRLLCLIPLLPLYINLQKWAAVFSCILGALYLKISGQGYPAQRAFWMMVLAMMGILFNRRTISIRIVMLCALAFLCIEPFCVFSLSFQLSFAAVISLISFFENPFPPKRKKNEENGSNYRSKKTPSWLIWLKKSFFSSATAGLLTLPLIAFYFHQISLQMFITNILAIPLTTFFILPLGILCCIFCVTPFASFFLTLFSLALSGLLEIALFSHRFLSPLVLNIHPFPLWILLLQLLSAFWLILWKSSLRWVGLFVFLSISTLIFIPPQESYFLLHLGSRMLIYCDHNHLCVWRYPLSVRSKAAQEWCKFLNYASLHHLLPNNLFFFPDNSKIFIGEKVPQVWPQADFYIFFKTFTVPQKNCDKNKILFCDQLKKDQLYRIDVKNDKKNKKMNLNISEVNI